VNWVVIGWCLQILAWDYREPFFAFDTHIYIYKKVICEIIQSFFYTAVDLNTRFFVSGVSSAVADDEIFVVAGVVVAGVDFEDLSTVKLVT
jgi:hypothetical protein